MRECMDVWGYQTLGERDAGIQTWIWFNNKENIIKTLSKNHESIIIILENIENID